MFFKGEGKYVVEVLGSVERPWSFRDRVRGTERVYTLRVLESDDAENPVGSEREFGIRLQADGYPYPAFQRDAAVLRTGLCLELQARRRFTRTGQPFTSFHWGDTVNGRIQSMHVTGRITGSTPNVQHIARPVAYGATCKRCNEHNPHAEFRVDFVCYGCRH